MRRALAAAAILIACCAGSPAFAAVNARAADGALPLGAAGAQSARPDSHPSYGPLGEVWRVPMQRREIALTFDDGPFPFYTPLLLHVLDQTHVHGTFFVVGRSAQEFPQLVERIVASGDEIGNHTFNHYKLTALSNGDVAYQIAASGLLLERFTGHPLTLFRPPHGRYDHRVVYLAHEMGYQTIFWNDMPGDVEDISTATEVARAVRAATPGGIVLLHSGQYKTIEALPAIIGQLRERGYTFVTVGQLLADGQYQTAKAQP